MKLQALRPGISSAHRAEGVAVRPYGTLAAHGASRGTDAGSQLHHGLVEVSGPLRVHQRIGESPEIEKKKKGPFALTIYCSTLN